MRKIAILTLLMSVLFFIGAAAYSQNPSPSQVNKIQAQSPPKSVNQKSNGDKKDTNNPTPFINQLPHTQTGAQATNDNANKQNYEETTNRWIMWATVAMACFAFFQFVALVLQYFSMNKQAKSLEESIKLTQQSIDLTKQEFITSHPPKLRVHSISLHRDYEVGKPWKIHCYITNIGGSEATIIKSNLTFNKIVSQAEQRRCDVETLHKLPAILPFSGDVDIISEKSIACGESKKATLVLDNQIVEGLKLAIFEYMKKGSDFYLFGYVDYVDGVDTKGKTAFCRQFDTQTERFSAVQDDDYEYSY